MWPKPSRKKGKSQGTKSRLKAIKEDKSDSSEDSESTSKSEKRKTRPPNRNRSKRSDKERKRTGAATQNRLKKAVKKSRKEVKKTKIEKSIEVEAPPELPPAPKEEEVAAEVEASPNPPQPQEEEVASEIGAVWKDKILEAYKGNPKNSHTLLKNVPNQRAQFEAGERQKLELIEESMVRVVDKMFDNFQNTAYGFNQVTQGSDLELVWIRPSFVEEEAVNWTEGTAAIRIFTGRISTRYWTLVIRGTVNAITSFILPSDKLLSFGQGSFDYDPYVELIPVSDGMSVTWTVMDHEITQDLFPSVFRALLDGLIRFANEEAEPDESFRLEDIGIVSGVEQQPEEEEPPERFESEGEPELLSLEDPSAEPEPHPQPQQRLEPEFVPQQQQQQQSQRGNAPVEMAIEMAFEAANKKAEAEKGQEVVDPGAGFIQSVSSALATEATQEMDKLRESIKTADPQVQAQYQQQTDAGDGSEGQWKLVGSNLPPAVASQWESYVKKTGDEEGAGAAPGGVANVAGAVSDEGEWNMIAGTENLKPAQTVSADMAIHAQEHQQPQPMQQQMPPQQQIPQAGVDNSGWVHPSQQEQLNSGAQQQQYVSGAQQQQYVSGAQQQQYVSGAQQPVSDPDRPYEHPEAYPRPANYDDEETLEFAAPTGHSQFLLTEEDVDDRAIQTPPPDPNVAPPPMAPDQEPEMEDDVVYEEEVEYIEESVSEGEEEIEYEEEIEEDYQRPRGLVGALTEVVDTIDMKVERLSQKGAEAFANKDFKRAEVIIKLSERLNDFKNEANQLLSILGQEEEG